MSQARLSAAHRRVAPAQIGREAPDATARVFGHTPSSRALSRTPRSSAACNIMRARNANCCEVEWARTRPRRLVRRALAQTRNRRADPRQRGIEPRLVRLDAAHGAG